MEAMQFSGTEISWFDDDHHDENFDDGDLTNQYFRIIPPRLLMVYDDDCDLIINQYNPPRLLVRT